MILRSLLLVATPYTSVDTGWRSSIRCLIFGWIWICTEEFELLDLVDPGVVGCNNFSGNCHTHLLFTFSDMYLHLYLWTHICIYICCHASTLTRSDSYQNIYLLTRIIHLLWCTRIHIPIFWHASTLIILDTYLHLHLLHASTLTSSDSCQNMFYSH